MFETAEHVLYNLGARPGKAIVLFAGGGAVVGEVVEELVLGAAAAGESCRLVADCAAEAMSV